jgi:hypothetical protein
MSRKVYVTLTVKAVLRVDEGVDIGNLFEEGRLLLEHPLVYDSVDVEQLDIENHEITDSK